MKIPSNLLLNKNILLGVSGSIAIYKSLELVRLFSKAGANVKVVMSKAAKKFITPLSFETLTQNEVLDDENESWANNHNHIATTKWADIFVIAPATANTIAKIANGIADSMLLECALAFDRAKVIAPAANTNMINHPSTQANLKMINMLGYEIIQTQSKELACRTTGDGAMADIWDIFFATARELLKEDFWINRRVIVSGGATIEKIDDVRYISNFSSGKMANALALALYCKGCDVNLTSSNFIPNLPKAIHTIEIQSSKEMFEYLQDSIRVAKKGLLTKPTLMSDENIELVQKTPYLFMASAVSDYVVKFPQNGKLKKELLGDEFDLKLIKNIDILSTLDKDGIITVGFKAEMDKEKAMQNAKNMLQNKNIDGVCLNILKDSSSFGSDTNEIEFITKDKTTSLPKKDKLSISFDILEAAKELENG